MATHQFVERYFAFTLIDDEEEMHKSFRIRYQVFCVERGLLPEVAFPSGEETDEYDRFALHFLASHVSGQDAGTARLVIPNPLGLPLAKRCILNSPYDSLTGPNASQSGGCAEISRLAITKAFRRREGDTCYGGPPRTDQIAPEAEGAFPIRSPNHIPEILSGIYRLLYQESKRRSITHWLVAMERSLQVMLRRMGFYFDAVGPETDYHGPVRPYVAEIAAIERHVHRAHPQTLRYMLSGLEPHLIPGFARDNAESSEGARGRRSDGSALVTPQRGSTHARRAGNGLGKHASRSE